MKTSTWNILTVVMIAGILLIGSVYTLIFISPNIFFNPFPPAALPPTPFIPTITNTPLVFPPTWTNTPTITQTPTQTSTPTLSPTFTLSISPSETLNPTLSTTPTLSITPTRDQTQVYMTGTFTKTKKPTKTPSKTPTPTKGPWVLALAGVDDYATTTINTPVFLDVLANDYNLNPDPMHIVGIIKSPTLGSAEITRDWKYITYTPNPGTYGTDHFTYKFTDEAGWMSEAQVTVLILNPSAHAPTDITLTPSSVDENAGAILIGTFSSIDDDPGDTFTYTLINGSGDTDNNRFYITGNKLFSNQSFDAEAQPKLYIRVRTTDSYHYTYDKALTIDVKNRNEFAPVIMSADNANGTEGVSFSFTITATDNDYGETLSYSITEILPSGLTFDSSSHIISGTPATGSAGSHSLTITVTDSGGLSATQTFTLTIVSTP